MAEQVMGAERSNPHCGHCPAHDKGKTSGGMEVWLEARVCQVSVRLYVYPPGDQ